MLKLTLTPNISLLTQFRLGLVLSVWLVAFLVFIGPFDGAELPLHTRAQLMPPYGFIFLLAYLAAVWLQNLLYRRLKYWNLLLETFIVLFAYSLCLVLSFAYYQSPVMNGTADFSAFTGQIFMPTVLIISFLLFFGRWFISRKETPPTGPVQELIVLQGDNKNEVLRLPAAQLVCVLSAQNYAEVHYLLNGELKKQLLRTTLSKLVEEVPLLLRVHRSCLVNPTHFIRWEGNSGALFHSLEVPVSKQYREQLNVALKLS